MCRVWVRVCVYGRDYCVRVFFLSWWCKLTAGFCVPMYIISIVLVFFFVFKVCTTTYTHTKPQRKESLSYTHVRCVCCVCVCVCAGIPVFPRAETDARPHAWETSVCACFLSSVAGAGNIGKKKARLLLVFVSFRKKKSEIYTYYFFKCSSICVRPTFFLLVFFLSVSVSFLCLIFSKRFLVLGNVGSFVP